jgi:hypothetical protein
MKSLTLLCVASASVAVCTGAWAGPTDRAVVAAMKLSEQPDYSWHTTIEDGTGSYIIDGKTSSHGYTWVRLPMIAGIARRLDHDGELTLEAYFRGKTAGVVRSGDTWRTLAELPATRERIDVRPTPLVRGSASAGKSGRAAPMLGAMIPLVANEKSKQRAYTTVRFGFAHPHEELAIIVSCATRFDANGEIVTGVLSETGAALLLVRDEQTDTSPLAAAGEFKLWLRHGYVVKYHLKLEGLLAVDRRKVAAHVNATTVLHDIGSTRLAVPDEVRGKLER